MSESPDHPPHLPRPSDRRVLRAVFLGLGLVCMGLGVLGILLPILPTTPFLLLAAACFARSSERLHHFLLHNRVFGDYLRRYRDGEGMPLGTKLFTLALFWSTLALSIFGAVPSHLWWVRLTLAGIGLGVTLHILRTKAHNRR